jgi:hypothetical protein
MPSSMKATQGLPAPALKAGAGNYDRRAVTALGIGEFCPDPRSKAGDKIAKPRQNVEFSIR